MTYTTAVYRDLAQQAEKFLLWREAADYWQAAIAAYPRVTWSALAERDIGRMHERQIACEHAASSAHVH